MPFELSYTLITVSLGAALLGVVSGTLGTFAVLRGQSLLGDAISHAALPGIALAFLLTGSKAPLVLLVGAALAGWLATYLVTTVVRTTRIKYDAALGLGLSVFFGFGLMLLTFIQKRPDANQAGLGTYLFGQAAALVQQDVVVMAVLGLAVLAMVGVCWNAFKLLAFDPGFAHSLGLPVRRLDALLTLLLVVAIVIGLQTVGVVLMSAMVVAPAAAARQWTHRLGTMLVLAAGIGAGSGVAGAVLSSTQANLPTGPMIVLCIGGCVLVSLLLAPARGVLWQRLRAWRNARRLRLDAVLLDLYALAVQHAHPGHPHEQAVLDVMGEPALPARQNLKTLEAQGLVYHQGATRWALTPEGMARAEALFQEKYRS